jgi:hypothetical protein
VDKGSAGNDAPYPGVALVESSLQSSIFNLLITFVKCGQHFAVNPNPRKVMDGLKHHTSIFSSPNLDTTLRVGKTAQ